MVQVQEYTTLMINLIIIDIRKLNDSREAPRIHYRKICFCNVRNIQQCTAKIFI